MGSEPEREGDGGGTHALAVWTVWAVGRMSCRVDAIAIAAVALVVLVCLDEE